MWFTRRKPKIGERWEFKDNDRRGDPWGCQGRRTVDILDVKDGWVRFSMGDFYNDERLKMGSFLFCYRPPASGISN